MLNENIKRLRISRNQTQVELADAMSVSKQCVSNWENDNVQPSVEMLVKLANYFDVSTDYLLGLEQSDTVSLDGLTDKESAHIKMIVADLKSK